MFHVIKAPLFSIQWTPSPASSPSCDIRPGVSAARTRQTMDTPTTLHVITHTHRSVTASIRSHRRRLKFNKHIRYVMALIMDCVSYLCARTSAAGAGFYCIKQLTQFLQLRGHSRNILPAIFVIASAKLSEKYGFLTATIVAIEPSC
jgi:hypothetical protein